MCTYASGGNLGTFVAPFDVSGGPITCQLKPGAPFPGWVAKAAYNYTKLLKYLAELP